MDSFLKPPNIHYFIISIHVSWHFDLTFFFLEFWLWWLSLLMEEIDVGWKEMEMYYHDLFNSIHLYLCFFLWRIQSRKSGFFPSYNQFIKSNFLSPTTTNIQKKKNDQSSTCIHKERMLTHTAFYGFWTRNRNLNLKIN